MRNKRVNNPLFYSHCPMVKWYHTALWRRGSWFESRSGSSCGAEFPDFLMRDAENHSIMSPLNRPSLSVVLPTYNERINIGLLIPQIEEVFRGVLKEIIVVDDSSPDGTGEEANRFKQIFPQIKLFVQSEKGGIGKALRFGYGQATGDVILSSDVDLSFSVFDLRKIYDTLVTGYDLVVGSRHTPLGDYEVPSLKIKLKYLASKFGNRLLNGIFKVPVHDFSANCRAIRRSLWNSLETRENTNFFLFEMILLAARAKARITEVPVSFKDRRYGVSKINHLVEIPKAFGRMIVFLLNSRK